MLAAAIILVITYIGIAFTRLPRVNIDRPAAALAGALLMVLAGVLSFEQAVAAIDFDTMALLLGMMLLVVVLERGGFFTLLTARSVAVAGTPRRLMLTVVLATAVSSAFLVNDVVVLLFTPVVIHACRTQRVNPVPYLIGEAMASNIGSTATIVGNPQNMLIGITSGISFARFSAYLAPVAVASMLILLAVLWAFYHEEMRPRSPTSPAAPPAPGRESTAAPELLSLVAVDRSALLRSVPILALVVLAFFVGPQWGLSVPLAALTAGVTATVVSGIRPSEIIRNVDWVLLLFFGGLFVVIGGAREAGLLDVVVQRVDLQPASEGVVSLHLFSAVASQLVSNVPLTIFMLPLLEGVPGHALWASLAAGATLAGNATLIGAVANIIVVERAYREGVIVRFGEFFKVGIVVTALTMGASLGILLLQLETGFLR